MKHEELRELHDLLFNTIGLFHEKFLHRFPKGSQQYPGIKKNHFKIMFFVHQNSFLTATEIARSLNMEKGSLTTLIDQLEEVGLVIRSEDNYDRRRSLISLTQDGKALIEAIADESIRRMGEILTKADSDELHKLADSLRYTVEFMKRL